MNRILTLLLAAFCLTAVGQSEYCLEGTVWDDELGGCVSVILNSADINNDGCVQLGDLLDLLTAYGDCAAEESPWQCGDPVGYQGYDYATVLIGDQCWFAENLRSNYYSDGSLVESIQNNSSWANGNVGMICTYGNVASNEVLYGSLYNWYAVDDARGLCPSGWHVPTDGEWMTLEMALGMSEAEANIVGSRGTDQGAQMKSDYGWVNGGNGTNESGFSGLPGGGRGNNGDFDGAGYYGYWWCSSLNGSYAWSRGLFSVNERVSRYSYYQRFGFSVRCIKDTE